VELVESTRDAEDAGAVAVCCGSTRGAADGSEQSKRRSQFPVSASFFQVRLYQIKNSTPRYLQRFNRC